MIKITKDTLDSNIKELINLEINLLNNNINIQKQLNTQILIFLKNFIVELPLDNQNDGKIQEVQANIDEANFNLKKIKFNLASYDKLLKLANKLILKDYSISDLKLKIEKYNKTCEKVLDKIFINTTNIENYIHKIQFMKESVVSAEKDSVHLDLQNSKLVENTLIISEIHNKVVLPYTFHELEDLATSGDNLSEIINKNYTIPLKNYKYAAISRFKEAYKLINNKEKGSKKDALNLAIEMFANYNLHPAIITACKNVNQLDIYLSCLEYNELDDFHFFKIIYEIPPIVVKSNSLKERFDNIIKFNFSRNKDNENNELL